MQVLDILSHLLEEPGGALIKITGHKYSALEPLKPSTTPSNELLERVRWNIAAFCSEMRVEQWNAAI